MSFIARPKGITLRRLQGPLAPADERFDHDHPVAMRCQECGQIGHGPRKDLKEALEEHRLKCPARRKSSPELVTRLWYPTE